jgi:hypothetical protein
MSSMPSRLERVRRKVVESTQLVDSLTALMSSARRLALTTTGFAIAMTALVAVIHSALR